MHIGKNTRMAGMDESSFEYEVFHEPVNLGTCQPAIVDDKKYVKCGKGVDWTCMQKG
jgi:hypothetical protein